MCIRISWHATNVREARIQGIHLRLPGCGESGTIFEIFQYTPVGEKTAKEIHAPGISHIAFSLSEGYAIEFQKWISDTAPVDT